MVRFLDPETTEIVPFLDPEFAKWTNRFMDPEIEEMVRFLDPEIVEMVERSFLEVWQYFVAQTWVVTMHMLRCLDVYKKGWGHCTMCSAHQKGAHNMCSYTNLECGK